jgi:cytochrome c oxidase assembly protein subunit 15
MTGTAPRSEQTPPSSGFRRLAYGAVALTFALVIVGGVVRVSDSGLGCGRGGSGTDGWPLCGGRLVPLIDTNMIVEYSHRVLAASLTLVIAALALIAWRRYRANRALVRISGAAFGLVLFQAGLGGLTVEKGLKEELVATHLGVAMLQIGLLILLAYIARSSSRAAAGAPRPLPERSPGQGMRVLAIAATAAALCTIVAGGYMSASELHGTPDKARGPDVHTACGTDFPTCGGEFLPFGRSRQVDIHLTHRAFMYLTSLLVLSLFALVLWQRRRRRSAIDPSALAAAGASVAILCGQVTLGAINVWAGEHEWLIVAHLAGGTLLWCSLVVTSLLTLRAPRIEPVRTPTLRRALSTAGGEA